MVARKECDLRLIWLSAHTTEAVKGHPIVKCNSWKWYRCKSITISARMTATTATAIIIEEFINVRMRNVGIHMVVPRRKGEPE